MSRAAVNAQLVLDDELQAPAGTDWRGAQASPRGTESFEIAQQVVKEAQRLTTEVQSEGVDVSDSGWMRSGAALSQLLGSVDPAEMARRVGTLSKEVRRLACAEPSVVKVPAPAKVYGDIHGQLRDLLLLLGHYGFPSHHGGDIETTAYVFNGDWVDRGKHQLDVVVLLFALKCLYPARIFLVGGRDQWG